MGRFFIFMSPGSQIFRNFIPLFPALSGETSPDAQRRRTKTMDDHLSKLQLWAAEKNMLLFFNELNTYYDLIKSDLDDYDMEDMEILAMDIDNALTALKAGSSLKCMRSVRNIYSPAIIN